MRLVVRPPEQISGHELLHLIALISGHISMVSIPVTLIDRPHPWPLTPSLARLVFEILPATGRIMMQSPILMRVRKSSRKRSFVLLLPEADHGVVVEADGVDMGDGIEELRADKGLGVLVQPVIWSTVGYTGGIGLAETRGWYLVEATGVVGEPGDGEAADVVFAFEVVFPETQPVE